MEPLGAPGVAQIALGLGDLVGVVGEGVVDAAAVQVQILAVILHGDAGALDVPAGIAHAPGGVPLQGLVLELGLGEPQDKVVLVALVHVLFHALPDAHGQILLVVVIEDIVAAELGGVEVHVASRHIGIALLQQGGDDLDILVDAAGGGLDHVGPLDIQLPAVLEKGVGVILGDLHHRLVLPAGALEHLVLAGVRVAGQVAHVGDVHHPVHVIAVVAQELLQHVLHDIGAQIADVGEVVHGGAAGVHLHVAGGVGLKGLLLVGGGIIQKHGVLSFFCGNGASPLLWVSPLSGPAGAPAAPPGRPGRPASPGWDSPRWSGPRRRRSGWSVRRCGRSGRGCPRRWRRLAPR